MRMKLRTRVISVLLTVSLLVSTGSFAVSGENEQKSKNPDEIVSELQIAAMSDLHFFPKSMTGGNSEAWKEYCTSKGKEFEQSTDLTETGLDTVAAKAKENGTKYLLIPGDLTKDGEYEAHTELAKILENFEKETGIQVIVTCGNHDINNEDASTFASGTEEKARQTTQAEFREIYKNLGWDIACDTYTPPEGSTQGGLSYTVDLDDNYRLIVIDSCKNNPKAETGGMISDDLMSWIKSEAADAESKGMTCIAMEHHSVAPHMTLEPSVTFAFCVDNYQDVAEQLADAGIHYVFTGHLHTNDIASVTSDNGETIYDCEVGSLTGYPNYLREAKITTYGDGESKMDYSVVDVDYAHNVVCDGVTYEKPFRNKSFAINYGGNTSDDGYADTVEFFMGMINGYLIPMFSQITEAGGIDAFLKIKGIDLSEVIGNFLEPYIGSGVKIGSYKIFTTDNIMWFVDDLLNQIEEIYINHPENFQTLCRSLVTELVDFQVSDVPCTKFIDTLHFGDASKGGTLGDLVFSAMSYWDSGDEDISDDAFMQDAIKGFSEGDSGKRLFNKLLDMVFNEVVDDALLSKLNVRLDKLFNQNSVIGKEMGCTVDYFTKIILKNNTTYKNLVDTFFSLGAVPYTSLYDILDKLALKEYMTDSQYESIGKEIARCLSDFVTDTNPKQAGDLNVTYTTETVTPEATQDNYRLPTMLSETMGKDTSSEAVINWFSKSTVEGDDIEIYKADSSSDVTFTGIPTESSEFTVSAVTTEVERTYPGIDLGIIGFFNYNFKMNKHTVTLSGLEAGSKYYYRVGDASRNWWSDTGCIETADNSNKVTFFHMSDPQSQSKEQYERAWANVVSTAFDMYPDAKFILNTGDLVDYGSNTHQWQWLFDTASSNLLNTYLMPTTGNHEGKADYSTVNNFALENLLPDQDTASGVYYSFDYNNVHVMVLNSNDLSDSNALSDKQIEWLKKDASESSAQWKIVAIHKAPYSNGSHYDDKDVSAIRTQLSTLMPELDIDVVFQGHDHVYLRTYSLDNNKVVDSKRVQLTYNGENYIADVQPTGTTYVISGTSGVKTYTAKSASETDKYFPRAEAAPLADESIFSAIQIDGGILYFDAYKVNGDETTKIDSFAIQKNTDEGDVTGDAEDVSAADHDTKKTFLDYLKEFFSVIKKIFTVLLNIYSIYFGQTA